MSNTVRQPPLAKSIHSCPTSASLEMPLSIFRIHFWKYAATYIVQLHIPRNLEKTKLFFLSSQVLSQESNKQEWLRPGSQSLPCDVFFFDLPPIALFPHFLGKGVGSSPHCFLFLIWCRHCCGQRWKWMAPTSYRSLALAAEITVVCGPWWFMVVVSSSKVAHGSLAWQQIEAATDR